MFMFLAYLAACNQRQSIIRMFHLIMTPESKSSDADNLAMPTGSHVFLKIKTGTSLFNKTS